MSSILLNYVFIHITYFFLKLSQENYCIEYNQRNVDLPEQIKGYTYIRDVG